MHVYHYAGNNPIVMKDPNGRQSAPGDLDGLPDTTINVRDNEWDIYAIKGGTVVYVNDNSQSYGITIVVQDENGEFARYAHLDSRAVSLNDTIEEGQVIGVMGSTGTDNRHLHVSVYPTGTAAPFFGANATIDPETYIQQGTYPANTSISTPFGATGRAWLAGVHEGTDFSGLQRNLLPNWRQGFTGEAGIEARSLSDLGSILLI